MHYAVVVREVSVLLYESTTREQYDSFQIQISGQLGTIHSLRVDGFYEFLAREGFGVFTDLGLTCISVVVTDAHLRLIIRQLRRVARIEVRGAETIAGKKLTRVEMRVLEAAGSAV